MAPRATVATAETVAVKGHAIAVPARPRSERCVIPLDTVAAALFRALDGTRVADAPGGGPEAPELITDRYRMQEKKNLYRQKYPS
jgi:hypothetical protein